MDQVIFKYPGQKFVGLATRNADGSLAHQCFMLVNSVPKTGETILDRLIAEVLTDDALLTEMTHRACVDRMEAVAVLREKTKS